MSIFKHDDVDLSKIKPQPYERFEETERRREAESSAAWAWCRRVNGALAA